MIKNIGFNEMTTLLFGEDQLNEMKEITKEKIKQAQEE